MARPRGEICASLMSQLAAQALPVREVTARLRVPMPVLLKTLSRLQEAGDVVVVRHDKLPGARRPMAVYGLAGVAYHS